MTSMLSFYRLVGSKSKASSYLPQHTQSDTSMALSLEFRQIGAATLTYTSESIFKVTLSIPLRVSGDVPRVQSCTVTL